MTKLMYVLFGGLTLGALYLTANDVGVQDAKAYPPSVRSGSVGHTSYVGK